MPADDWAYDRLNPAAPLEGLRRVVEQRQAVCVPRMFARDRSHSLWCHGVGVEVLRRYGTSLRRDGPMPDSQRLAQTLDLPQGMKPEEYIAAFMAEFGSGANGTVLHESLPGITLAVSRAIFEKKSGALKVGKRGRDTYVRYLAHGIKTPDEVWYVQDASGTEKLYYLARMQAGRELVQVQAAFKWDGRGWEPVTGYQVSARYIADQREWLRIAGVLLWQK